VYADACRLLNRPGDAHVCGLCFCPPSGDLDRPSVRHQRAMDPAADRALSLALDSPAQPKPNRSSHTKPHIPPTYTHTHAHVPLNSGCANAVKRILGKMEGA
jgi:hypothetical protein